MALWILCAKSVDPALRGELLALSHISRTHASALLNLTDMGVPTQRKVGAVGGWGARAMRERA